jgi:hypothetical protein
MMPKCDWHFKQGLVFCVSILHARFRTALPLVDRLAAGETFQGFDVQDQTVKRIRESVCKQFDGIAYFLNNPLMFGL